MWPYWRKYVNGALFEISKTDTRPSVCVPLSLPIDQESGCSYQLRVDLVVVSLHSNRTKTKTIILFQDICGSIYH